MVKDLNIKIVGLGDGGARAISKMIATGIGKNKSVEFLAVGKDENILLTSEAQKNIFLNRDLTTVYKNLADGLDGANVIFIVAGLAGNAARAAVPLITTCAKNLNAVTVAFVCRPAIIENIPRKMNATHTLEKLRNVDTLFVVPAEKFLVFRLNQPQISLDELFEVADDVFCQGVKIFLDMLLDGDTNLALFKWGNAAFGYGEGSTALDAVKNAVNFPTLEADDLSGATGIFLRLASGKTLPLKSIDAANNFIQKQIPPDAGFFSQEEKVPALGEKVFASIILTRK